MSYLFDTDALSELSRPRPRPEYVEWLRSVPRGEQFTSAFVIGELFGGVYLQLGTDRYLRWIRDKVLPQLTVLPFDARVAEVFGRIRAELQRSGQRLPDADLAIAATALAHDLILVTGNVRHHGRIAGLRVAPIARSIRKGPRRP
jgi:predicted nucleic acid-binding protein